MSQEKDAPTQSLVDNKKKETTKPILVAVALTVLVLSLAFYFYLKDSGQQTELPQQYVEAYTLVNDSISKSANVVISLPEGVVKETAFQYVTFEPEISGSWIETPSSEHIAFQPDEELPLDRYYRVTLETPEGESPVAKEFHVVEDPAIEAIFPKEGSETNENSSITIIFNRPMVPLTTLSELDKLDIPVEITPETKGKFKWISTRNLQFIPEERLIRSSNYTVAVKEGFVSMDGLSVQSSTNSFVTRPLRYSNSSNGTLRYDSPVSINFNQPIDIDKTASEISVRNISTGKDIAFIAEYNHYVRKDLETKKEQTVVDRSRIKIYPKVDSHGRERLWDFNGSYQITMSKAFPLEGDIILEQEKKTRINITDVIKTINTTSERTNDDSSIMFDPEGTYEVEFYENIDLRRSEITAKGLAQIEYAKKCEEKDEEDNSSFYKTSSECKKVDDASKIIISFNSNEFSLGESFNVEFKKIYNEIGLKLNTEIIRKSVTVYPKLKIFKIIPNETDGASLTEMVICSNTPLQSKTSENYKEAIETDGYLVFVRWRSSYKASSGYYNSSSPCSAGEYVNKIEYGLLPKTDYEIKLSLEDDFGQQVKKTASFKTTTPSSSHLRLFDLQKTYNVTTPSKTNFTYAAENFTYADLSICKMDPVVFLKELEDRPSETTKVNNKDCLEVVTDTIDLPDTFWVNHYFQFSLEDYFDDTRGHYVITLTNPNFINTSYYNNSGSQKYHRTYASVTNLAVVEKRVDFSKYDLLPEEMKNVEVPENGNIYWVTHINDEQSPASEALVRVYKEGSSNDSIILAESKFTDSKGIAELSYEKDVAGAVVTLGDESAILSSWADKVQRVWGWTEDEKTYLYTDRPIYRPGEEIFIKGIHRVQYDGAYSVSPEKETVVEVYNSKREKISTGKITLNDYGTFSAHLKLPDDAPLGNYQIKAFNVSHFVDVQEYVPAAYEADIESSKEEYVAGEEVDMTISAKYYFGVPLDGGEVEYTFTAQDYHFDKYTDEYFNFGGDWYYCYGCGYNDSYIGRGKTTLDKNGVATIRKKMDFEKMFSEDEQSNSKIIVLHATIQDLQGKSLSLQKSFIVHRGEYYLGVKTSESFVETDKDITIRAKTVDTQGEPTSQKNIDLTIRRIEWKSYKRKEVDGGYYNKWEKEEVFVLRRTIRTNRDGDWSDKFSFSKEGRYEITLTGRDSIGNTLTTTEDLYVYGDGNVSIRPTNNATLEIEVANQNLDVGDTAEVIIKSPYENAKALVSIDRGQIFDYEIITINKSLYKYEFEIKEKYIPNVHLSVILLSPDPEIKFSQEEFYINRDEKTLRVEVKADKDYYLPGEEVSLEVITKDSNNRPVQADVSIAVADLSVLALKGNQKKDPLVFFYQDFPMTVITSSNVKNILEEAEIPAGTKGGGGMFAEADDLARKKRGIFKDTAFWESHVETDTKGYAKLSFTLPDNLTRWQMESIGVTKDTKLGVDYREFTSRKDVMTVPIHPRFVIPGDEFSIGAKIFNQLDSDQKLDVTFESETLILVDNDGKLSEKIKAGETKTVYFDVRAPRDKKSGAHSFVLSAKNDDYEDTVEKAMFITPNSTYETVATAYHTINDQAYEYVYLPDTVQTDQGGLTIRANATMAVFLTDALNYLIGFPYGCSEQIASKLSAIAIVKEGLNLPNVGEDFVLDTIEFNGKTYEVDSVVNLGLKKIYENQVYSGGFSYYRNLDPNLYLTIHIVEVLQNLKEAGYKVDEQVLSRASNYIVSEINSRESSVNNKVSTDTLIIAAYTLARLDKEPQNISSIKKNILNRVDEVYLNEKISSSALAHLAILTTTSRGYRSLKKQTFEQLENRIDIDSRGAYLKTNESNVMWSSYETKIKNTALLLKALTADEKDSVLQGNIVRWLLASRSKDGAWGTTNNTLTVVDSFTDFLQWSRETESDFQLDISFDEDIVASFDFNPQTILSTYEYKIPMSDIELDTNHRLSFDRTARNKRDNRFYYDIGLQYYFPVNNIPARDEGITIERAFYNIGDSENTNPVLKANVGDVLRGEITITTPKPRREFALENIIPAGTELVNFDLSTEDKTLLLGSLNSSSKRYSIVDEKAEETIHKKSFYKKLSSSLANTLATILPFGEEKERDVVYLSEEDQYTSYVPSLYYDFKELHDDRLFLFKEYLRSGTYKYEYYIRVTTPGTFQYLPAIASELYFPENFGRTAGEIFTVTK